MTSEYSVKIGLKKSFKNTLVIAGVPALIFLVDNWAQWLPDQYNAVAMPIFGFLSYLVKNYVSNR